MSSLDYYSSLWYNEELDPRCWENGYDVYNLTHDDATTQQKSQIEVVVRGYVLPCILAIGLFGNGLFLFVVARVRTMRTITNLYLVNLAVADLVYLTVGVGEKVWRYHASPVRDDETPIGTPGCISIAFVIDFMFTASVLLVTLVSLERYYAICKPLQHLSLATWGRTTKMIILTWVVSLVLSAVIIPGHYKMVYECYIYPADDPTYDDFPSLWGYCAAIHPWYVDVASGFELIPFFIAMIVVSVLYALIIKSLSHRVKTYLSENADRFKMANARNAVTRMLVITGVLFFLLLSPYQVATLCIVIAGGLGDDQYFAIREKFHPYWPIFQALMYLNSAINAYVYGATNARYRQALVRTFQCSCKRRPVSSMTMNMSMTLKNSTQTLHEDMDVGTTEMS